MENTTNYRKYILVVKNVEIPTTEPTDKDAKNLLKKVKNGLRGESRNDILVTQFNDELLKKVDGLMSPSLRKDCKKEAMKMVKDCDRLFETKDPRHVGDAIIRVLKAEIICPYSCGELKAKLIMKHTLFRKRKLSDPGITFPLIQQVFELIRDCQRVISFDPNNEEVYDHAMELLMEFGERSLASACYTKSLMLHPGQEEDKVRKVLELILISYQPSYTFHPYNEVDFQRIEPEDIQGKLNAFIERMAPYFIDIYENKRLPGGFIPSDVFALNPDCPRGQGSFGQQFQAALTGWDNKIKQQVYGSIDYADKWNRILRDNRKVQANGLVGQNRLADAVEKYGGIISEAYLDFDKTPKEFMPPADVIAAKYQNLYAEKANLYLLRAGAYILMKSFDGVRGAIRDLDKVLSLDASSDKALYWRAWCYHRIKKRGRAIRDCKACLKIKPQHHKALNLVQRLEKKGKITATPNEFQN